MLGEIIDLGNKERRGLIMQQGGWVPECLLGKIIQSFLVLND